MLTRGLSRFCLFVALGGCAAGPRPADLVLHGGIVWTGAGPVVEAVAVRDGRIAFAGDDAAAAAYAGPATEQIDLRGKLVLPGFHDSHVHPVLGGMELAQCVLGGLPTPEAVLAEVAAFAAAHPEAPWVLGNGWELPVFGDGGPTREALDAIVPDRPAYIVSADGHSAWVNSEALRRAGVSAATPDPPGGRIERDAATGAPTGTLREDAMAIVAAHVPAPRHADYVAGLRRALEMTARLGITSLQEANASEPILDAYLDLDRRGELTANVCVALELDHAAPLEDLPRLVELRRRAAGSRVRVTAAKIFVDGVIEAHTAALLEPYLDRPGDRGPARLEPEVLNELVTALDAEGFQVHVHAIGDRAVRMTLDAFEAARARNGVRDARHHIAHVQLVDPADVPRFAALDVTANFQPYWALPDRYITELTIPRLGPERSRWIYAIGSVAATGADVVFGSDWSVSSMNPLDGIQVALTRRDPDAPEAGVLVADEAVDLETALRAYTINGARLAFAEGRTGTLEPGKAADLVVLDRNVLALPPMQVREARVVLTLLGGAVVYEDAEALRGGRVD